MTILENISPSQRKACIQVAELLKAAGGRALLVGGCVREGLLGIEAKDVDMEVYGLTHQTQRSYISGVKGLSGVCHISAEQHHR